MINRFCCRFLNSYDNVRGKDNRKVFSISFHAR